jgi:hypothetical protein
MPRLFTSTPKVAVQVEVGDALSHLLRDLGFLLWGKKKVPVSQDYQIFALFFF